MDLATSYHHAISNRLFLSLSTDELSFVITDKNLTPLETGLLATPDDEVLANVLKSNTLLNQIFAHVSLTFQGNSFVCSPPIFSSNEQKEMVFKANHQLKKGEKLLEGSISNEISVLYAAEDSSFSILKNAYPSLSYSHELETALQYLTDEIQPVGAHILLKQTRSNLLLIASDGKNLLLANQFNSQNMEDVFYYTMLAVEQLEMDIEQTTLSWCSNTQFVASGDAVGLFEHYIKNVKVIDHPASLDSLQNMRLVCG